jgi:hypothetical protein
MLTVSICSPPASPESEREDVGTDPSTSAIEADPSASATGADPSASATGAVTIAVAGTAPPAGVTSPPATGIVVETPRAMRVNKAVMKKSSL